MYGRFATITLMLMVVVASACSVQQAPPTFEPLPTPTTPPSFVTYKDEANLFTIEYPTEWELGLSFLPDLEKATKDLLLGKQSDLPVGNIGMVFFVGYPTGEGFDPNVNIVAEALPEKMSVDEYAEASQRLLKDLFAGYRSHGQSAVVVGGREGVILDYEVDLSNVVPGAVGKQRNLQLFTVDDKVAWAITCSIISAKVPDNLRICESVLRSFKILR